MHHPLFYQSHIFCHSCLFLAFLLFLCFRLTVATSHTMSLWAAALFACVAMVATQLSCSEVKQSIEAEWWKRDNVYFKIQFTFYSLVFLRWSRHSKCSDKSFHTSRAGRPALRQENLVDAVVLPREENLGFADLLLYLPLYIYTLTHSHFKTVHSRIHLSMHAHSHYSPLKALSVES